MQQEIGKESLKMAELSPQDIKEVDFNDWQSVLEYIWHHRFAMFLLVMVVIMVYYIDYLSNLNALLFGLPSAVPIAATSVASAVSGAMKKKKRGRM